MKKVRIVTDGSCNPNPGLGGWAYIISYGNKTKEVSGIEEQSTNNRMELTAALKALESLKEPCEVELVSDSQYLIKGLTEWMFNWRINGWRLKGNKPLLNPELWKGLYKMNEMHKIKCVWVKGHNGNKANERADKLANDARKKHKYGLD